MVTLWENALDTVPESVLLWREYLAYRLSSFTVFTVTSMREGFASSIQSLRRLPEAGDVLLTHIGSTLTPLFRQGARARGSDAFFLFTS